MDKASDRKLSLELFFWQFFDIKNNICDYDVFEAKLFNTKKENPKWFINDRSLFVCDMSFENDFNNVTWNRLKPASSASGLPSERLDLGAGKSVLKEVFIFLE